MRTKIILICAILILYVGATHAQGLNCNQSLYLSLNIQGEGTITPDMFIEGNSGDPYDSLWVDITMVTCDDIGSPVEITTFGELADGTVHQCTSLLTVEDKLNPIAICEADFTVDVSDGPVTLNPADIDDGSFDNCGIASIEIEPSVVDCYSGDPTIVVMTVTDESGNQATAVTEVYTAGNVNVSFSLTCDILPDGINVEDGPVEVFLEDILESGPSSCLENYSMTIMNSDSNGPDPVDNTFTLEHVGETFFIIITEDSGQQCYSEVTIYAGTQNYFFCVYDFKGDAVANVSIVNDITDEAGCTTVTANPFLPISASKEDTPENGVDAIDIMLMTAEILDVVDFTVEQRFAADINGDGEVNVSDIVMLLQMLVGEITLDQVWYFYYAPLMEGETQSTLDQTISVNDAAVIWEFTGIKLGDIDLSYNFSPSNDQLSALNVKDIVLNKSETQYFDLSIAESSNFYAMDISIPAETSDYAITNVTSVLPGYAYDPLVDNVDGVINLRWVASDDAILAQGVEVDASTPLITFEIESKENSILSHTIQLTQDVDSKWARNEIATGVEYLDLVIKDKITVPVFDSEIETFSIIPNPADHSIIVTPNKVLHDTEYCIYSMTGTLVKAGVLQGNLINVSDLEIGFYQIVLQNEMNILSQKLSVLR